MAVDIESLYRTMGPMVLRRCRRLLRDEGKAVDAMHDVFVELLRRKESLTADAPAGLLLRTATNVCLNRLRTQRRHPEDRDDELVLRIAAAGGGLDGPTGVAAATPNPARWRAGSSRASSAASRSRR